MRGFISLALKIIQHNFVYEINVVKVFMNRNKK